MPVAAEIAELRAEIDGSALRVGAVLVRAGVARTTWSRWIGGHFEPRAATLRKVRQAIADEKAALAGAAA